MFVGNRSDRSQMEDLVPTHILSKEPIHTIHILFNPLCVMFWTLICVQSVSICDQNCEFNIIKASQRY